MKIETVRELKKYGTYTKSVHMTFDIPYDLMQDMQNINSVQPRFEVDMCEIF